MRLMHLLSASWSALVAAALPAAAADIYSPAAPAPAYAAASGFNWTGVYVGANVGYTWGKHDWDPATATITAAGSGGPTGTSYFFRTDTDFDSSFIGGGQVGYNWQFRQWVIGAEADLQRQSLANAITLSGNTPYAGGPFVAGDRFSAKTEWLGTLRARAGVSFDRFLVFGTAGFAFGGVEANACYVGGFCWTDKQIRAGYVVGAGAEFAVSSNVSLKVEYDYVDLGRESHDLGSFTNAAPSLTGTYGVSADVDYRSHILRAGANYRFDLF